MKKIKILSLLIVLSNINVVSAQSIDPISFVIAKVIKALDLQVQKLQNSTIWLQEAQQVAEHQMSKFKLAEIANWQQRQEDLYAGYFQELSAVKSVVKGLPQVKQILTMQAQVVNEYNRFAKETSQQNQFDELLLLSKEILQSLQQVTSSNQLSMKDADRVMYLCTLRDAMNECLDGIKALNKSSIRQAAVKARAKADLQFLQKLNSKP